MHVAVVYDSRFGNTEQVASIIAATLTAYAEVDLLLAEDARQRPLRGLDLLVVGSPVHGGRPTESIGKFLNQLPTGALNDVKVAAFDTRFRTNEHGPLVGLLMRIIGFAAGRILKQLQYKGGTRIADPIGFIVLDKEGPLESSQIERAQAWSHELWLNTKTH